MGLFLPSKNNFRAFRGLGTLSDPTDGDTRSAGINSLGLQIHGSLDLSLRSEAAAAAAAAALEC